jgi:hypothetical protein
MLMSVDTGFFWEVLRALKARMSKAHCHKKTSAGRKYTVASEGYF